MISSHILEELHKLETDYIFLDHGKIVQTITAKELDQRIAARNSETDFSLERYFMDLVTAKDG